jgi:WXXGXW repeat (2 copies)
MAKRPSAEARHSTLPFLHRRSTAPIAGRSRILGALAQGPHKSGATMTYGAPNPCAKWRNGASPGREGWDRRRWPSPGPFDPCKCVSILARHPALMLRTRGLCVFGASSGHMVVSLWEDSPPHIRRVCSPREAIMFTRSLPILLGAGLLTLLAIRNAPADPDVPPVPPPQTDGIDVQARGPVHEAFAQPVDGQPRPSPVVAKEPPAPIDEAPPDQKPDGDNVQWIPGYWQYDGDRADFVWVSGFWRTPPPGRQWTPGHWDRVDGGWQWVSGSWVSSEQEQVTYLPPPPATIDVGPSVPPPDTDSTYVPGCWVYRETRYRWRPGYFIASRPDFCWTPAHYDWTPAGCVFVGGYWDYPLAQRGLLFAPVCFDAQVLQQPDFVYTPQYVVSNDFLPTALFVGPSCHDYYFGDYFGNGDERRGFRAWGDYRIGRYCHDPLFDYYRTTYADRGWEGDMRDLYAARYNGDGARLPHTLGQQNRLIDNFQNNVAFNKSVRGANIRQVSVLSPLAQAATVTPLVTVPASALQAQRHDAAKFREAALQQRQAQHEIVVARKAPLQVGDPPRVVKTQLPKLTPPPTFRGKTPLAPPPAPTPLLSRELKPTALPQGTKDIAPVPHRKEIRPPGPIPQYPPPSRPKELTPPPVSAHPKNVPTPVPVQPKDVPLPPLQRTAPLTSRPKELTPPPVPAHPKNVPTPVPVQPKDVPPPPLQRIAPPPQRMAPPPPLQRIAPPPQRMAPPPPLQRIAPPPPPPQRNTPPSPPPQRSAPPPQRVAPPPPPQRTAPPPALAHPKK